MTDRLDHRSTSQLAALERRLERALLPTLPSDLRRRVLSAVDAALDDTSRATVPGWSGESLASSRNGLASVMLAVAAAIALVVLSAATTSTLAVPLSLDDRARIAGVSAAALGPLVAERRGADPALHSPQAHQAPAHPGMLRVLDGHLRLQETL